MQTSELCKHLQVTSNILRERNLGRHADFVDEGRKRLVETEDGHDGHNDTVLTDLREELNKVKDELIAEREISEALQSDLDQAING